MFVSNARHFVACAALVMGFAQAASAAEVLIADAKSQPESLTLAPGGVLIVGSGMSYHNLRDLYSNDPRVMRAAVEFDDWLENAVTESDPAARERKLAAWHQAPGARAAHPRPEHLIPLMVAAGAAGEDLGRRTYNEPLLGKPISGFQFG